MISISVGWRGPIGPIRATFTDCECGINGDRAFPSWNPIIYTCCRKSLGNSSTTDTFLLFDGLDTFADISFCGQHVATTANQFRQYYFNISSILSACNSTGLPELRVDFASAPGTALSIAAQPGQETWPPRVEGTFEFAQRQFVRKEQSDFGWDWGPAFAPAGIWQKAWVIQLQPNEIVVRNSAFDIYRKGQLNNLPPDQGADWIFNASIDAINGIPEDATMRYRISGPGGHVVDNGDMTQVNNTGDVITGMVYLNSSDYELWWPTGMGPQTLYNITVDVVSGSSNKTVASVTKRTGFRTIVLNMGEVTDEEVAQGIAPGNHCRFFSHPPDNLFRLQRERNTDRTQRAFRNQWSPILCQG